LPKLLFKKFKLLDNGKLLRIAHFFTNKYFENDDPNEERVELLEEIQLFEQEVSINQIEIIKYVLTLF
jgi:hypothetical protein